MNGPGLYEDTIARLRRKAGQLVRYGSVLDGLPQNLSGYGGFQARVDARLGSRFQNHPCFGFASVARRNEVLVRIGRMYLNRKALSHIKELQQQWEPIEVSGQSTEQLLRRVLQ